MLEQLELPTEEATTETWRPVPGYEGRYDVSDLGRVRSWLPYHGLATPRLMNATPDDRGYPVIQLFGGPRTIARKVHRLVLETFVGPRPEGFDTRHLDGDTSNNRLSNLRYGTRSENNFDAVRHGTHRAAAKTHCVRGHSLADAIVRKTGTGRRQRQCRECRNRMARDRWARCGR